MVYQGLAWLAEPVARAASTVPSLPAAVIAAGLLVAGAFAVTRELLGELEAGVLDPLRFYIHRLLLLGAHLLPLCLAVTFVNRVDPDVGVSARDMAANVGHALTYTFNWWAADHPAAVPSELGHLWYFSVQQQCYALLPLVLLLLGRRPRLLALVLAATAAGVGWWRYEVLDERGWVYAASQTTTMADGVLLGAALALLLPWLGRRRGWRILQWVGLAGLLAAVVVLGLLGDVDAMGPGAAALVVASTLSVAALWCGAPSALPARLLSWSPVRRLGRASLATYVWHLPVIVVVARHTESWAPAARVAVALAVLAVVVLAMRVVIEQPTRDFLGRDRAPATGSES